MPPAVILAGGLGTRLADVTGGERPKALVEVAGRPFIDWKLAELSAGGITEVLLLVGHHGDAVAAHVGDGTAFGVRARFLADGDVLLGTGGSIRRALPELPDAFWVTYGDSLLRVDIGAAETEFARSQDVALMTVWHNRNTLGPSNALVRDGLVVEYSKQPPPEGAEHIDYGMLLMTRAAFAGTPPDQQFDLAGAGRIRRFQIRGLDVQVAR